MWNNGDGVPVEIHKDEGVYVPELIFGHLLTSSNYNDMEKKVRRCSLCCSGAWSDSTLNQALSKMSKRCSKPEVSPHSSLQ